VVEAVPALRALGRGARVAFCGQPRLGELLAGTGTVAEAVSFDGLGLELLFTREPAPALAARLAAFDVVVSWFGARDGLYPARLAALVPAAVVAAPVPPGADAPAVWRHLLATLDPLGPAAGVADAPLAVPPAWRARARRALDAIGIDPGRPFAVLHPGAGGRDKLIAPAVFAAAVLSLAREGRAQVLVHQGPADALAAERLADLIGRPPRLIEPALPVLAGVLALAAGYLGGDSGVSHLAAAVGAPAVVVFPPAASIERWASWSPTATNVPMADGVERAAQQAAEALRAALGPAGATR